MELGESVIFQPVLQTYTTRHSWIITPHISLGNLECHWKLFNRQLARTQQLLRSLDQHPLAPTQLLSTLQLELSNIKDIYNSGETTITSAIKFLQSNQPQTHICCRRSLHPFLGDALSWLTETATTKDIHSIKIRINQLIATQASQCNTLVHIVSILNITRYTTQVNRHSINTLMDAVRTTSHDINNLYNLTTSLATSINFNQMILHIRSVFANLCDSLNYIQMVSTHTMEYINAATSGTLSPHVLPVIDLQRMLQHIADTLPPILHLPISPENTLHFYRYLHTHVLIKNKQFLLIIDIPIQDRSWQITIHQILTLDISHISRRLLNGKAPHHEFDTFTHVKGLLYKHITDAGKKFLALVIPKSWKYTVLMETHDKLGHQGNSCTYCLIKCQYYWKGMNKDILKYIANCVLGWWDKAKVQQYPLQMTEIPDRPFDKIAIDLVNNCKTSTSGNKHILTIIDHLTGWSEAFLIPDKSTDTIVATLINEYLPVHMCPQYILSDNGTEFKNSLMDQVLQELCSIPSPE